MNTPRRRASLITWFILGAISPTRAVAPFAPMLIPHIANDQCSPFGVPSDSFLDRVPFATAAGGFDRGASVQLQQLGFRCRKMRKIAANPKAMDRASGRLGVLSLDFTIHELSQLIRR